MQCIKPIRIYKNLSPLIYPDGLEVPCGKCIACRIAKRKEWTMRMLHELDSWEESSFVTLTYNDDNIPENGSLKKKDLQKFFKRIRKQLDGTEKKIKYYACGEYGEDTQRPHYHAIIFGLSMRHKTLIEKCWKFGFVYCGLAEPFSIQYVAQYIDKKFTGDLAQEEYEDKGREPVFKICSLGIGKKFVLENSEQLIKNEKITMFGVNQTFPRYYIKLLKLEKSNFRKERALEKNMEVVEHHSGVSDVTFDDFYKAMDSSSIKDLVESIKDAKEQYEKNLYAKVNLRNLKI